MKRAYEGSDVLMPEANKYLAVYLNDHLAGATAGTELAKRSAKLNQGSALGEFLSRLVREIEEDRTSLEDVMDRLGVHKSPIKPAVAWIAERVGRLKLNAELTEYSPLSRVLELEGLCLGVHGKACLWRSLQKAPGLAQQLTGIDLAELEKRAEGQLQELERFRDDAAGSTFA